jgi:two-component system, NarL family, response regulator NreC
VVVDPERLEEHPLEHEQRETEVLLLIALGFTSSEISEKLHLSRRTIDAHRRQIHRKLGLGKRSELVRYAMARNLIGANLEMAH